MKRQILYTISLLIALSIAVMAQEEPKPQTATNVITTPAVITGSGTIQVRPETNVITTTTTAPLLIRGSAGTYAVPSAVWTGPNLTAREAFNAWLGLNGFRDIDKMGVVTFKRPFRIGEDGRIRFFESTYPTKTCHVDKVYDGDNISCVIQIGRKPARFNLRIVGIDAPEVRGHQAHYLDSRDALRAQVLNQDVTVEIRGWDSKWKRYTVRVLNSKGQDIGLGQVSLGLAWYYPLYARTLDDSQKAAYQAAMDSAKSEKLGIWADKKPVKPADWRKGVRK